MDIINNNPFDATTGPVLRFNDFNATVSFRRYVSPFKLLNITNYP